MTAGKEVVITAAKGLKSIFNKTLDTYSNSSVVLTNGSGYDYLDNMVDEAGRPVLESDTANKRKLLFGLHPVTKVSDKTMPSKVVLNVDGETVDAYQHPIVCGDLKEAITLFDREKLTIELNSKSGSVFFNDLTKIKVRDRIDVQAVDKDAIIKAYVQVEA
jgi:HK97 family phage major capsid protein